MAHEILAKMSRPFGRTDGVGVDHQMVLVYEYRVDEEEVLEFQLDKKTVCIPLADMDEVKNASMQTRSAVYKAAIESNWYFTPVPVDLTPPRLEEAEGGGIDWSNFDDWVNNVVMPWRADVAYCQELGDLAAAYIEGLQNFVEWPYRFVLRS